MPQKLSRLALKPCHCFADSHVSLRSTADLFGALDNELPVRGVLIPVLVSDPSLLVQRQESLNCFPLHKQTLKRFVFRTFSS